MDAGRTRARRSKRRQLSTFRWAPQEARGRSRAFWSQTEAMNAKKPKKDAAPALPAGGGTDF